MKYPLFIALRYFLPCRASALIAIISAISMGGIALGVWAFIVVISVQSGMEDQLRSELLGVRAHLSITARGGVRYSKDICRETMGISGVIGAAPTLESVAFLSTPMGHPTIVEIHGLDPELSPTVTNIKQYLRIGTMSDLDPPAAATSEAGMVDVEDLVPQLPGVFLGQELAKRLFGIYTAPRATEAEEKDYLRTVIGRHVTIAVPNFRSTLSDARPAERSFEVRGIVRTGYFEFDNSLVFMRLREAQDLFDSPDAVGSVMVKLSDPSPRNTWKVKTELEDRLRAAYPDQILVVHTWMQENRVLNEALGLEKKVMGAILSVIILVAIFSIASTLIMLILTKRPAIGILRAMGASRRGVVRIFVALGGILSGVGVVLGAGLGYGTCRMIQLLHVRIPGGGAIYYDKAIPVNMHWEYFAFVIVFTIIFGALASLVPAFLAARLVPVEAIHHE